MKYTLFFFVSLLASTATAQTLTPNLHDTNKWQVVRRQVERAADDNRKAVTFNKQEDDGLMILNEVEFSEGTIEFDVKGENLVGRSFVGIAFHLQDENTFDAIYFRPFNFLIQDTVRRRRAVQYISSPEYGWEKLRLQYPGKFENKVNPVPDPDGWFHVRVELEDQHVRVFVNNASMPTLAVQKISAFNTGKVALWVGNGSSGSFANLALSKKK